MTSPQTDQLIPGSPRCPEQYFTAGQTTFAEVYQTAACLQAAFSTLGPDSDVICLATEDKGLLAASLLAGLTGGPALLLPNSLSPEGLSRMQQTTGFTVAVTDKPDILPRGTRQLEPLPDTSAAANFSVSPDRELLRLFTGGSTGNPKIWSKTAGNLFAEARYLSDAFSITAQDRITATVSPCHIYGLLFSVLTPLVSSATVSAAIPSFPAEIADTVQTDRTTILAAVPAHFRVLRHPLSPDGALRFAVSSAGMLAPADNNSFCELNKIPVIEVYGSTETGGIATRSRFVGETAFTPFTTVDWKINNSRLLVRSPYISARAQLDRDDFFVTGDRVKADTDNSFILQGRADHISKVGGKRVDLEEIREAIRNYPGVEDCFVLPLPDPRGRENQICALVQAGTINIGKLTAALRSRLEPYALPRRIRTVRTIPMTGAGKYDLPAIRALLAP